MHHKSYIWDLNSINFFLGGARPPSQTPPPVARTTPSVPGSSRLWCLTLAFPFTNPVSTTATTGVHCSISGGETAECQRYWSTSRWKTLTHRPLHVWNGRGRGPRGPWLHNRRRQSEITALCHLWLCVVAALDKTNDGAEWRISARLVTDFHWTGTDPIHSDRSRSRVSTKIGAFSIQKLLLVNS